MKSTPEKINIENKEKTIRMLEVPNLMLALANTIKSINRLDNTLSAIAKIQKTNGNHADKYLPANSVTIPIDALRDYFSDDKHKSEEDKKRGNRSEKTENRGSIINGIENIAEIKESALNLTNLLSEVHPVLKNHNKPLSTISNVVKVSASGARTINTISAGTSLVEGALAAGELMTNVVALTEVLSGPAGWALLLDSLAVSGVAAYPDKEQQEEAVNAENKKKTKRALRTFRMSSTESDDYIFRMLKRLDKIKIVPAKDERDWKRTYNPAKEVIRKYGKQAYGLSIPFPVAVADNTHHQLNVLPHAEAALPIAPESGKSYLSQTNALQNRLMSAGLTHGMVGFENAATKEILNAKAYDLTHKTNTAEMKKLATLEVSTLLLKSANDGKKNPTNFSFAVSNRKEGRQSEGTGSKMINVHINKPMIEHFTINTSSSSTGINEFKTKIEEVLLEILNSANAIQ
jgi:hypothetical protein